MAGPLAPYTKPALSFPDQVALLKSRGLNVGSDADALAALQKVSYYRLSAYWQNFLRPDETFRPGTALSDVLYLYDFDRRLRLLVMDAIERVEVQLRTRITYEVGHAHGPFGHTRPVTFLPTFDHGDWYKGVTKEIRRAREVFVDHYKTKYSGFPDVPLWMASELMTFGSLSKMFENLPSGLKKTVVQDWPVHQTVAESWIHTIVVVRNICAHHSRLWNRSLRVIPKLPRGDAKWIFPKNDRIYVVLCILREMTAANLGATAWAAGAKALMGELNVHPNWQAWAGVPPAWATSPFWT